MRGGSQHNPQYANYWAPLTRKRHIPPHPAQPQHTNDWAPRTRKRHQREHRPQRPTERSDPTQHAKGRTGDCPGPRKGATTRRNVTQGGRRWRRPVVPMRGPDWCSYVHQRVWRRVWLGAHQHMTDVRPPELPGVTLRRRSSAAPPWPSSIRVGAGRNEPAVPSAAVRLSRLGSGGSARRRCRGSGDCGRGPLPF